MSGGNADETKETKETRRLSSESEAIDDEKKSQHSKGEDIEDDEQPEENAAAREPQRDGGAVEKVQSRASVNNTASIPNGGLRAWLQVAGAFSLFFNSW